jgi:transcription elongation factor GreA
MAEGDLLALWLGRRGAARDARLAAGRLLERFGGLAAIVAADAPELARTPGVDAAFVADLKVLREERPKIVEAIEEARAHGDLSENAEYHAAKERQGQVEAQIAEIEDKVSRAQIIDPTTLSGNKIIFGATVTLLDENDKPIRYQIVGQTEADANKGRISYNSPLARALIGKQVGDEIEVTVPSGEKFYLVDRIEFI